MRRKNSYVYTCPDVINYRKNQYRLAIWSNVISYGYIAAFLLLMNRASKKTEPTLALATETPTE